MPDKELGGMKVGDKDCKLIPHRGIDVTFSMALSCASHRLPFPLQAGPIKVQPLYSTLPPQQQQKIFDPVSELLATCILSGRRPCLPVFTAPTGVSSIVTSVTTRSCSFLITQPSPPHTGPSPCS